LDDVRRDDDTELFEVVDERSRDDARTQIASGWAELMEDLPIQEESMDWLAPQAREVQEIQGHHGPRRTRSDDGHT
jgi:hypothetical protein